MADYDFPKLRGAVVESYSGQTWSPSWFSAVSRELPEIAIHSDGSVSISGHEDCNLVPNCTNDPALVQPGDLLTIGFGVPGNRGLSGVIEAADTATVDAFVASHIDLALSTDMAEVFPDARDMVVFRLIGMEVEKQVLDYFDGLYGLRNSSVRIAVDPYWQTRGYVPDQCHPDNRAICEEVEAKLAEYERSLIADWQSEGYSLWYADFLAYDGEGRYTPRAQIAPAYDAFVGVILVMDVGRPIQGGDKPQVLANAVRSLAEDLGPETPVILTLHWGAMRFVVYGVFCEADVCTSAFSAYYSAYEPAISAMLESFAPGQIEAFGVSLFEGGAHFDIREPYETKGGFPLNRVGETGFNNPVMNLYLTQ